MKKICAFALCAAMLIGSVGCNKGPAETTAPATAEQTMQTTVPTETEPATTAPVVYDPVPLVAVSVPSVTDDTYAEDGSLVFSYSHQNISLVHPNPIVADAIIIDFLNRLDSYDSIAQQMESSALEAYQFSADWVPHQQDVHFDPVRIDRGVLSFFGSAIRFSGGIHPEHTGISANYDMMTGDVLTLASILTGSEKATQIAALAIEELSKKQEQYSLFSGFESIVESMITSDPTNNESWYLSDTGLCIYFSPYEIAPYSSGVIIAELPYEKLTGLLFDGYFPAEQDVTYGQINAQRVTGTLGEEDDLPYENIVEVIASADGEQIILHTDGLIQNVTLEFGTLETGDELTWKHRYCAFRAATIGADNAIMLQTQIPDETPDLCLSFISGGQYHSYYISKIAEDGSVTLLTSDELLS